jgi:uncharacterized coiled-coil protein SlyX
MEVGKENVMNNEERLHELEIKLSAFQRLINAVNNERGAHGNAE